MSETGQEIKKMQARAYQSLIIEHGIKENSIVYLPTGSGKTFIAIQIIKHFSKDLDKPIDQGGKRTVFLVNTNALAQQQHANLKNALPHDVGIFTGEQNVDFWEKADWDTTCKEYQIFVATTQVILDAVSKNFINIRNINVMVFDECHNGVKDHPMHQLMKHFANVPKEEQPRVIGLSGMLIAASIKPDATVEEINRLESTFLAKIVTVNNIEEHKNVLLYSTNPKEGSIIYKEMEIYDIIDYLTTRAEEIQTKLSLMKLDDYNAQNPKTLRRTLAKPLKFMKNLFKDFIVETEDMGPYGAYLSAISLTIHFELKKKSSETNQLKDIFSYCVTESELMAKMLHEKMDLDNIKAETILKYSSEKIRKMIAYLKKEFDSSNTNNLQCLIFVKRKYTAKLIYHILKEYAKHDADFPIKPDFTVGRGGDLPESIEAILSQSYNKEAVDDFRTQKVNCLVATNVLEEGIDIPSVNLVIMYNRPETYRSYVQSKGRARSSESNYTIFLESSDVASFEKSYNKYQHLDTILKKILIEKAIDKLEVTEETIAKEQEYKIDPYVTKSGAKLTGIAAISLLHRYATSLPNDVFTNVNVQFKRIDYMNGKVSVSITLPSQSKIKHTIQGDVYDNVRLAKQHAAYLACIELYKANELNDDLLPIDVVEMVENCYENYFPHWQKYDAVNDNADKTAGTSKRRTHAIKIPEQIKDCAPKVGQKCFIYPIKVQPNFATETDTLRVFRKLYETDCAFGILTTKRLPKLCSFNLFQSYGEIEIEISSAPVEIVLPSQEHLRHLENFHVMLFRDLLKTWQGFYVLDKSSYIVVPLSGSSIYWPLVQVFQSLEKPDYQAVKRNNEKPQADKYLHKVINPTYRRVDENYIVTHVYEHLTPLSDFPRETYANYKEYFEENYDSVKIKHLDQFLVEVRGIGNNLNLLHPGGGFSGRSKRTEKERMAEIYIPEICHNYKFPGDYWLKATLLPATLHRLHYLLLAENLRIHLIEKVGIGNPEIPQIYKLDVDYKNQEENVEEERNEYGSLPDFWTKYKKMSQDIKQKENKIRTTEKSSVFDKNAAPVDIDRNWTSITQLDIDNYNRFISENKNIKITPDLKILGNHLKKLNIKTPQLCYKNNANAIKLLNVKNTPQQKDLIKVLTTSKSGDVFDMERFEVLGDSFLKFSISLYLYKVHESWHEGYLTELKGKIVSNRNLFYCATDFGFPGMIKFNNFQPRADWVPPSTSIPQQIYEVFKENKSFLNILLDLKLTPQEFSAGSLSRDNLMFLHQRIQQKQLENERMKDCIKNEEEHIDNGMLSYIKEQYFRDKVAADCTEALIGCCVQSVGLKESFKLLNHLKILPKNLNFDNLLSVQIPPRMIKNSTEIEIIKMIPNHRKLENLLGYQFNNRAYLLQALTHASYPMNSITHCYQQLEFLGDAVLDFLVTSYIYENCPKLDPGRLTDLRSALVNNTTLSCIVVRHGIEKFLLSQNHLLSETIKHFANYQKNNNYEVTDQIELLVTEDSTATADCVEVPKVLGDMFESIIGAVYLDSRNDLNVTWQIIYKLMEPELLKFMANVPKEIVRKLHEYPRAEPKFFDAEKINDEKVIVPLTFRLRGVADPQLVFGIGNNKKSAKKACAKLALRKLMEHDMIK